MEFTEYNEDEEGRHGPSSYLDPDDDAQPEDPMEIPFGYEEEDSTPPPNLEGVWKSAEELAGMELENAVIGNVETIDCLMKAYRDLFVCDWLPIYTKARSILGGDSEPRLRSQDPALYSTTLWDVYQKEVQKIIPVQHIGEADAQSGEAEFRSAAINVANSLIEKSRGKDDVEKTLIITDFIIHGSKAVSIRLLECIQIVAERKNLTGQHLKNYVAAIARNFNTLFFSTFDSTSRVVGIKNSVKVHMRLGALKNEDGGIITKERVRRNTALNGFATIGQMTIGTLRVKMKNIQDYTINTVLAGNPKDRPQDPFPMGVILSIEPEQAGAKEGPGWLIVGRRDKLKLPTRDIKNYTIGQSLAGGTVVDIEPRNKQEGPGRVTVRTFFDEFEEGYGRDITTTLARGVKNLALKSGTWEPRYLRKIIARAASEQGGRPSRYYKLFTETFLNRGDEPVDIEEAVSQVEAAEKKHRIFIGQYTNPDGTPKKYILTDYYGYFYDTGISWALNQKLVESTAMEINSSAVRRLLSIAEDMYRLSPSYPETPGGEHPVPFLVDYLRVFVQVLQSQKTITASLAALDKDGCLNASSVKDSLKVPETHDSLKVPETSVPNEFDLVRLRINELAFAEPSRVSVSVGFPADAPKHQEFQKMLRIIQGAQDKFTKEGGLCTYATMGTVLVEEPEQYDRRHHKIATAYSPSGEKWEITIYDFGMHAWGEWVDVYNKIMCFATFESRQKVNDDFFSALEVRAKSSASWQKYIVAYVLRIEWVRRNLVPPRDITLALEEILKRHSRSLASYSGTPTSALMTRDSENTSPSTSIQTEGGGAQAHFIECSVPALPGPVIGCSVMGEELMYFLDILKRDLRDLGRRVRGGRRMVRIVAQGARIGAQHLLVCLMRMQQIVVLLSWVWVSGPGSRISLMRAAVRELVHVGGRADGCKKGTKVETVCRYRGYLVKPEGSRKPPDIAFCPLHYGDGPGDHICAADPHERKTCPYFRWLDAQKIEIPRGVRGVVVSTRCGDGTYNCSIRLEKIPEDVPPCVDIPRIALQVLDKTTGVCVPPLAGFCLAPTRQPRMAVCEYIPLKEEFSDDIQTPDFQTLNFAALMQRAPLPLPSTRACILSMDSTPLANAFSARIPPIMAGCKVRFRDKEEILKGTVVRSFDTVPDSYGIVFADGGRGYDALATQLTFPEYRMTVQARKNAFYLMDTPEERREDPVLLLKCARRAPGILHNGDLVEVQGRYGFVLRGNESSLGTTSSSRITVAVLREENWYTQEYSAYDVKSEEGYVIIEIPYCDLVNTDKEYCLYFNRPAVKGYPVVCLRNGDWAQLINKKLDDHQLVTGQKKLVFRIPYAESMLREIVITTGDVYGCTHYKLYQNGEKPLRVFCRVAVETQISSYEPEYNHRVSHVLAPKPEEHGACTAVNALAKVIRYPVGTTCEIQMDNGTTKTVPDASIVRFRDRSPEIRNDPIRPIVPFCVAFEQLLKDGVVEETVPMGIGSIVWVRSLKAYGTITGKLDEHTGSVPIVFDGANPGSERYMYKGSVIPVSWKKAAPSYSTDLLIAMGKVTMLASKLLLVSTRDVHCTPIRYSNTMNLIHMRPISRIAGDASSTLALSMIPDLPRPLRSRSCSPPSVYYPASWCSLLHDASPKCVYTPPHQEPSEDVASIIGCVEEATSRQQLARSLTQTTLRRTLWERIKCPIKEAIEKLHEAHTEECWWVQNYTGEITKQYTEEDGITSWSLIRCEPSIGERGRTPGALGTCTAGGNTPQVEWDCRVLHEASVGDILTVLTRAQKESTSSGSSSSGSSSSSSSSSISSSGGDGELPDILMKGHTPTNYEWPAIEYDTQDVRIPVTPLLAGMPSLSGMFVLILEETDDNHFLVALPDSFRSSGPQTPSYNEKDETDRLKKVVERDEKREKLWRELSEAPESGLTAHVIKGFDTTQTVNLPKKFLVLIGTAPIARVRNHMEDNIQLEDTPNAIEPIEWAWHDNNFDVTDYFNKEIDDETAERALTLLQNNATFETISKELGDDVVPSDLILNRALNIESVGEDLNAVKDSLTLAVRGITETKRYNELSQAKEAAPSDAKILEARKKIKDKLAELNGEEIAYEDDEDAEYPEVRTGQYLEDLQGSWIRNNTTPILVQKAVGGDYTPREWAQWRRTTWNPEDGHESTLAIIENGKLQGLYGLKLLNGNIVLNGGAGVKPWYLQTTWVKGEVPPTLSWTNNMDPKIITWEKVGEAPDTRKIQEAPLDMENENKKLREKLRELQKELEELETSRWVSERMQNVKRFGTEAEASEDIARFLGISPHEWDGLGKERYKFLMNIAHPGRQGTLPPIRDLVTGLRNMKKESAADLEGTVRRALEDRAEKRLALTDGTRKLPMVKKKQKYSKASSRIKDIDAPLARLLNRKNQTEEVKAAIKAERKRRNKALMIVLYGENYIKKRCFGRCVAPPVGTLLLVENIVTGLRELVPVRDVVTNAGWQIVAKIIPDGLHKDDIRTQLMINNRIIVLKSEEAARLNATLMPPGVSTDILVARDSVSPLLHTFKGFWGEVDHKDRQIYFAKLENLLNNKFQESTDGKWPKLTYRVADQTSLDNKFVGLGGQINDRVVGRPLYRKNLPVFRPDSSPCATTFALGNGISFRGNRGASYFNGAFAVVTDQPAKDGAAATGSNVLVRSQGSPMFIFSLFVPHMNLTEQTPDFSVIDAVRAADAVAVARMWKDHKNNWSVVIDDEFQTFFQPNLRTALLLPSMSEGGHLTARLFLDHQYDASIIKEEYMRYCEDARALENVKVSAALPWELAPHDKKLEYSNETKPTILNVRWSRSELERWRKATVRYSGEQSKSFSIIPTGPREAIAPYDKSIALYDKSIAGRKNRAKNAKKGSVPAGQLSGTLQLYDDSDIDDEDSKPEEGKGGERPQMSIADAWMEAMKKGGSEKSQLRSVKEVVSRHYQSRQDLEQEGDDVSESDGESPDDDGEEDEKAKESDEEEDKAEAKAKAKAKAKSKVTGKAKAKSKVTGKAKSKVAGKAKAKANPKP